MERRITVIPGPTVNRGRIDAELADAVKPSQKRKRYGGATAKVTVHGRLDPQGHMRMRMTLMSPLWFILHNLWFHDTQKAASRLCSFYFLFASLPVGMEGHENDF